MKFMLSWTIHEDKRHEAFTAFSQMSEADDAADRGDGIRLIGRWHDLVSFTGVAICESDDLQAVSSWALNWNGVLDIDIVPVLDDSEAKQLGRKKFGTD